MRESPRTYHAAQVRQISARTIGHYERTAEAFWQGTREHDVGQNYAALLAALEGEAHHSILDFGCGPGRDLRHFRSLGHDVIGLDGSKEFVAMARAYSGCEVLHQDFLALQLPANRLSDERYGCYFDYETWRDYTTAAGFAEVAHYYRPPGLARHEQHWLASVWRKA